MLYLLAETDKDRAQAVGFLLLVGIVLAGLIGVLIVLGLSWLRRYTRRRLAVIEEEREERRQAASVGRVDAWSAGSDRYVDKDKLPEDAPYDTEAGPEPEDPHDEYDDTPPGWDEQPPEEEQDPYGLFDDKPYRESEDEDEEEDDEDWDDDEEDKA